MYEQLKRPKYHGVAFTHCRHADPTRRKDVPSKAVRIRKMKKAAKFGDSAVPILHPKKSTAVVQVICPHV